MIRPVAVVDSGLPLQQACEVRRGLESVQHRVSTAAVRDFAGERLDQQLGRVERVTWVAEGADNERSGSRSSSRSRGQGEAVIHEVIMRSGGREKMRSCPRIGRNGVPENVGMIPPD